MAKKNGRPAFRPNNLRKLTVWALSVAGVSQDEIANHLGTDPKTLRKHFAAELATAKNTMVAKAVGVLAKHLDKNDRTTAMFTLKALAGWRDQGPIDERERQLNLDALESQIAFLERKLGVKPGETPVVPGSPEPTKAPAGATTH